MIEPDLKGLSVSKQCSLLSISRSSFYYEPKGESEMNLALIPDRQAVPGNTVLRRASDDMAPAQ